MEEWSEDLIPPGEASNFNQALMDLGARICLPLRPKCPSCPVRNFCSFPQVAGRVKRGRRRKPRHEEWLIAIIEKQGSFLIHRKEGKGVLAGLWQFPTVVSSETGRSSRSEKEVLKKIVRRDFGMEINFRRALPSFPHSFTHIRATMKPYLFSLGQEVSPQTFRLPGRWIRFSGLSRYPRSRAMAKVSDLLKAVLEQGSLPGKDGKP